MILSIVEFAKSTLGIILLTAIIADFIPAPTDWLHFFIQNSLYGKRMRRWKFELLQAFDWYIVDTLWWIFMFFLAYFLQVNDYSTIQTITTIATVLGLGAIIGITTRFVSKK